MTNDYENEKEVLVKKARFFLDNKLDVHINMKNGVWLNGYITQPFTDDYFLLEERKKGLMPVFFLQMLDIEKLEEKS